MEREKAVECLIQLRDAIDCVIELANTTHTNQTAGGITDAFCCHTPQPCSQNKEYLKIDAESLFELLRLLSVPQ